MSEVSVRILLATYNGSTYIRQMVDSVLAQDHGDFQLILSDDGSSDGTADILQNYAEEYPDRVIHYCSGIRFGSAQKHFMHLLKTFPDARYTMFCDQDDVWHSNKISKTLGKMRELEADPSVPVLVHTDLCVVDGQLQVISPSFCAHSALDGKRTALNQLLVQNVVTGCTVMINHALSELACRTEDCSAMRMHDWYLALLASAAGKIGFVEEATIDYRQHGNNAVGAKNVRSPAYLWNRLRSQKMRQGLMLAAEQAKGFLRCYEDILDPGQKEMVSAFAETATMQLLRRNRVYLKYGLLKSGIVRVAAQLLGW